MLCTVHVIVELACLVHVYHVLNYTLHVDNGYLCVRPGFCRILCLSEEKPVKSEQDKMVEKPVSTRRCMPHWAGFMKRRRERHTERTPSSCCHLQLYRIWGVVSWYCPPCHACWVGFVRQGMVSHAYRPLIFMVGHCNETRVIRPMTACIFDFSITTWYRLSFDIFTHNFHVSFTH